MNKIQKVIIVGNPNSGKTTLFNSLTGLNYKVANYPGVTVESRQAEVEICPGLKIKLIDLPGLYSFSSLSLDEQIAGNEILGLQDSSTTSSVPLKVADLVLCVVDASNLERNLYLASQLIDSGLKVILVLTVADLANKLGISIKNELLSRQLDTSVVSVHAQQGKGLNRLREEIKSKLENPFSQSANALAWAENHHRFLEAALQIGKLYCADKKMADSINHKFIGTLLLSENLNCDANSVKAELEKLKSALLSEKINCLQFEATNRYKWINKVVSRCVEITDTKSKKRREALDTIATHKVFGPVIFLLIMGLMFQSIFTWASVPMGMIDSAISLLGSFVGSQLSDGILKSLLVDGIIAGVGSVLIFIPQIAILFAFLSLLEESGYLPRAAFIMDRIMRPFGLQGRSFIPLLSCFACAVPGIMSARTIPSVSDRLTTILIAPLMSCSARLPVYTVLIAAVIPQTYLFGFISLQAATMFALYILGIVAAGVVGLLLRFTLMKGAPSLFVMEMPPYRKPNLKNVLRCIIERVRLFLSSAGTTILLCSLVLWFLAYFPQGDIRNSFAGMFGRMIEPLIQPIGFNWEMGIAILASFAAREVFVSALGTVFSLQENSDNGMSLIQELQNRLADGSFSLASGLSLLVFFAFACQCISTLAVVKRETGTWKWPIFMFAYLTLLAYVSSLITYNLFK